MESKQFSDMPSDVITLQAKTMHFIFCSISPVNLLRLPKSASCHQGTALHIQAVRQSPVHLTHTESMV